MSAAPQTRPSTSEIVLDAGRSQGLAVVAFDDLAERFRKERRIDVRDALSARNHFDNWHRRRRLPVTDDEGLHKNSSRMYFRLYRDDPDGEASCPPHADLWHWLLDAYRDFPWDEAPARRTRSVPVVRGMVAIPAPPTDEELAAGRARLEAANGRVPDEAWASLETSLRQRPAIATRIAEMLDIAADWHGGMFILTMEVAC